MKKLFHLALIVLIVFSVTSCSKSVNDLQPNEKGTLAAATQNAGTSRYVSPAIAPPIASPLLMDDQASKIYPFINQPHSIQLGSTKYSVIHQGSTDYIVFYVAVNRQYMDPSTNGILTLTESGNEQHIRSYNLISYQEAANYAIEPPDDLKDQAYMFAIVPIDILDNHINEFISLYSEINNSAANTGSITAKINRAFVYNP